MTFLKQSCERAEGAKRYPRMPERLAIEHADSALTRGGATSRREAEPWQGFLLRINPADPASLRPRDLRRLTDEMWEEERLNTEARTILDETIARDRKSFDRLVVRSYLFHFPTDHLAFDALRAATGFVARRREWPWRTRGDRWSLWDAKQGPRRVARALLDTEESLNVLRDAGLDGELAAGAFVKETLLAACEMAAGLRGPAAEEAGSRLMHLFGSIPRTGDLNGALAYALLAPWTSTNCSQSHQKRITSLLVHRVDDPRLAGARWSALESDVTDWFPRADVENAFSVLRRWLVQQTFREFFEIVARTTDRKDQWKQRTDFWMGYLNAGVISDAWFAFGSMAERLARTLLHDETAKPARIEGGGADASHSALLFNLGDLRIAEWSHNGRARFWRTTDSKAPALYKPTYAGPTLRAMYGGEGFDALSHNGNWEPKFARHIYRFTGVRHPRHGIGW